MPTREELLKRLQEEIGRRSKPTSESDAIGAMAASTEVLCEKIAEIQAWLGMFDNEGTDIVLETRCKAAEYLLQRASDVLESVARTGNLHHHRAHVTSLYNDIQVHLRKYPG